MTTPLREAQLEAVFQRRVRLVGGLTFKLAPTTRGVPDRLVLLPFGRLFLVELKTVDGTLSPMQQVWHERAALVGVRVHTIYGADGITDWIRERMAEVGPRDRARARRATGATR